MRAGEQVKVVRGRYKGAVGVLARHETIPSGQQYAIVQLYRRCRGVTTARVHEDSLELYPLAGER